VHVLWQLEEFDHVEAWWPVFIRPLGDQTNPVQFILKYFGGKKCTKVARFGS